MSGILAIGQTGRQSASLMISLKEVVKTTDGFYNEASRHSPNCLAVSILAIP
jgi:hypothetical protein